MDLPLVLTGRLVTFDEAQPVLDDGAVYIGADELIAAVQPRKDPAPAGFDSARVVRTGGAIYPGLIDLHGTSPTTACRSGPPRRASTPTPRATSGRATRAMRA
jgi:cytosine/adenosine deaminase-related metal-dependent hydrolase